MALPSLWMAQSAEDFNQEEQAMIKAFIMGMIEFRSDVTLSYEDSPSIAAYDWGREWMHRLTFRRYDY